ncbi:hypothetical protein CAPSP0001_0849 [Capnocytophaga sputigena ATCC 33612]|uniref:Transcriptional regulator n=1 Tax=Capnocytophaga sputigena TaxID=1019 RepID=A0AAX2I8V7_CAPSP|nr:hypothetical protein [Capnocytophaga sputigena]EEB65462.1 hypothetical protein CAPSP0001_0849 [Capnocytophaga sputigena ATCC 33612]SQA74852.1 Uncharacterised protein [Capnocytophaga sputigena]
MNTLFFTCEEINLNPRASWGELLQIVFINKEQYFSISRLAYEEELYFEYNEQTHLEKVLQELKKESPIILLSDFFINQPKL